MEINSRGSLKRISSVWYSEEFSNVPENVPKSEESNLGAQSYSVNNFSESLISLGDGGVRDYMLLLCLMVKIYNIYVRKR